MSLEQWMADFTIDNNGTLEELKFNLDQLMTHIN
jgi:dephospho-CoA kinase